MESEIIQQLGFAGLLIVLFWRYIEKSAEVQDGSNRNMAALIQNSALVTSEFRMLASSIHEAVLGFSSALRTIERSDAQLREQLDWQFALVRTHMTQSQQREREHLEIMIDTKFRSLIPKQKRGKSDDKQLRETSRGGAAAGSDPAAVHADDHGTGAGDTPS